MGCVPKNKEKINKNKIQNDKGFPNHAESTKIIDIKEILCCHGHSTYITCINAPCLNLIFPPSLYIKI